MNKILDDIWCGNICAFEQSTECNEQISDLKMLIERNKEALFATLTNDQKETLEKYDDCIKEILDIIQREIFVCGFRLGGKIMLATIVDNE